MTRGINCEELARGFDFPSRKNYDSHLAQRTPRLLFVHNEEQLRARTRKYESDAEKLRNDAYRNIK